MSNTLSGGTPAQPASSPSGRKRPTAVPWRDIACRLAEGARPSAIAASLGLQEERIWRHLRKSLRFRFYLQQAMERQRLLAGLQLATLGQAALVSRGLDPDSLDGDLLRLLNEAAPDRGIGQQIEDLGKTGERPPNMAFRRRLAEDKRQMDQQREVWRIQDAARAAAAPAGPAKAEEPQRSETNAHEPARTATNASEPARTATNTGEAPRTPASVSEAPRTPASASEAPRPAAKPDEAPPRLRLRWSRPPSPRPEPRRPPVVDLAQGGQLPDS